MASLNSVNLIGRLTRDPELRTFSNGGAVAMVGVAIDKWSKDENDKWKNDPTFVDVKIFNSGKDGLQANAVAQNLKKGNSVVINGRLHLEQWKTKSDENRSKLIVVADKIQSLEPRDGSNRDDGNSASKMPFSQKRTTSSSQSHDEPPSDDEIPF